MKTVVQGTKIVEVRFDATLNKGNYENEKIGLTAVIGEEDDALAVLQELKDIAYGKFKARPSQPESEVPTGPLEKTEPEAKPKKASKKAAVETKSEPEQSAAPQEKESAEQASATELPKGKTEPEKKQKKSTATPYQRTLELHKKLVGQFLDSAFNNWRLDVPLKEKCKAVSAQMEGVDFLDNEGIPLETFKLKFKELMK